LLKNGKKNLRNKRQRKYKGKERQEEWGKKPEQKKKRKECNN
jgi:hypothetical protein